MRFLSRLLAVVVVFCFPTITLASELTVKVADASQAPVFGAQVEVFAESSSRPIAMSVTSAQGIARFHHLAEAPVQIRVLAAGFAEEKHTFSAGAEQITITLHPAVATETVVVLATRTPVSSDETGSSIALLTGTELETMHPVAANDALRFLPGAIVSTAGQRGGLGSLFVRGGDSRYNKVLVDGVAVNDPGGTFDFGTLPVFEADRVEFLRGAESTLYGSDAMTSVVQVESRTGATSVPELSFGADAGSYGTQNGYASLSGANSRFDYNLYGNQFNTSGSGPNADYSNSLAGANAGLKLNDWAWLRLRMRHQNSVAGVQSEWNFNGDPLLEPDLDQRARLNSFLSSLELAIGGNSRFRQRLQGFDYTQHRTNEDHISEPGRYDSAFGFNIDTPFHTIDNANRAGANYQADYAESSSAVSTGGYEFENETGAVGDTLSSVPNPGLRRNHALFGQQVLVFSRGSIIAGGRWVHNQSFGNKFVPRIALSLVARNGGNFFASTRLRFGYATGIKEPSFAESFGNAGDFVTLPNPGLKPEQTRSFEAGVEQSFTSRYALSATYFNNLFRNKIDFNFIGCDPVTFVCSGQYVNVNEAIAHGAEVEFQGRPASRIRTTLAYAYTSTQILKQPFAFDPLLMPGQPLLRRPKHSATALITYLGSRWGAEASSSFVGRRADSDFLGFGITHAPGYVVVNAGLWYRVHPRVTAYVNGENLTNRFYEEVTGYPALGANFRAGIRFRVGGE
ncbi:MAG TPA: TonB-dependent receptor [Terriglobales bacterium]|jgi:vitamin B12 transporter|nr:TonB-dependent receptor [Terriglobales bacterium]